MPEPSEPERYQAILEELGDQIEKVENELEDLEDSGEADQYPVKHQKARNKVDEINEQMSELKEAMQKIQEHDQDQD